MLPRPPACQKDFFDKLRKSTRIATRFAMFGLELRGLFERIAYAVDCEFGLMGLTRAGFAGYNGEKRKAEGFK